MTSNNPRQIKKSSKPAQRATGRSFAHFAVPAIIALAALAPFLPVFHNGFVNPDDYEMLVDNFHYRGLAWSQLRWMFTTFHMGHFQPLSWLTFSLDYLIWGTNPVGYHLTNLLLHSINAVLFFFLARRLLANAFCVVDQAPVGLELAAALTALFFAIHPLRVESVVWATERRDVLSGLFFLITLICHVRTVESSAKKSRRTWLTLALVAYFFSLAAKATAITLPVILLLLDVYPLRRLSGRWSSWFQADGLKILREKIPFGILAVLFAVLALFAQQSAGALRPAHQYFFSYRIGQAVYGIIFYLWKTVLPLALSPLYELPYDFGDWTLTFVVCGAAALGITVVLFLLRQSWLAGLACWVYYLVMLAPVLGVAQSGPQLVADRYSYLSCMSWVVLLGGGFFYLWQTAGRRTDRRPTLIVSALVLIGVLIVLGGITSKQTKVWHDTRTLWKHVIAVAPPSSIAYYNLGRTLEDENNLEDAFAHYNQALTINPTNPDAHYNLARLLTKQGKPVEAITHYRQALVIRPADADTHNNLGLLLALQGDIQKSLAEFQNAARIDPSYGKAFFNMGRVLAGQGRLDEAIQNYRRALQIDPNEVEILTGLGEVLIRRGQLEEAVAQFEKAVTLKPELPDAHVALARALATQGKKNEAEKHYQEALRLLKLQAKVPQSRY